MINTDFCLFFETVLFIHHYMYIRCSFDFSFERNIISQKSVYQTKRKKWSCDKLLQKSAFSISVLFYLIYSVVLLMSYHIIDFLLYFIFYYLFVTILFFFYYTSFTFKLSRIYEYAQLITSIGILNISKTLQLDRASWFTLMPASDPCFTHTGVCTCVSRLGLFWRRCVRVQSICYWHLSCLLCCSSTLMGGTVYTGMIVVT